MYRGRFAPTPSGPLHLGSLLTALASWLQARSRGGIWLLRIDDLDRPRCVPGAEAEIRRQLLAHGLRWDEEPLRQSGQLQRYRQALARLAAEGHTYRCICTRQVLRGSQRPGPDGPVYPGSCRAGGHASGAVRARLPDSPVVLDEAGTPLRRTAAQIGDPVVERSDGTPGYALASVLDEEALGITEIVRGGDLLGASFQQQALRTLFGLKAPAHRHLPLLTDGRGRKLSKQNHAPPIDTGAAADSLRRCLALLGQEPVRPDVLEPVRIVELAAERWNPELIPARASIAV